MNLHTAPCRYQCNGITIDWLSGLKVGMMDWDPSQRVVWRHIIPHLDPPRKVWVPRVPRSVPEVERRFERSRVRTRGREECCCTFDPFADPFGGDLISAVRSSKTIFEDGLEWKLYFQNGLRLNCLANRKVKRDKSKNEVKNLSIYNWKILLILKILDPPRKNLRFFNFLFLFLLYYSLNIIVFSIDLPKQFQGILWVFKPVKPIHLPVRRKDFDAIALITTVRWMLLKLHYANYDACFHFLVKCKCCLVTLCCK